MTPEELLVAILKQSQKIIVGQTLGMDGEGKCTVQGEGGSVRAIAGGDLPAGNCAAFKADDGQWYAVSATQKGTVSKRVIFKERRKPLKVEIKYPVKIVYTVYPDDWDVPGAAIEFYIGGDRAEPELILELPVKKGSEYVSFYNGAKLTNTGLSTDDWILQLTYSYDERTAQNYSLVYCRTVSPEYGDTEHAVEGEGVSAFMINLGYGAFIDDALRLGRTYSLPESGALYSFNFSIQDIQTTVAINSTPASGSQLGQQVSLATRPNVLSTEGIDYTSFSQVNYPTYSSTAINNGVYPSVFPLSVTKELKQFPVFYLNPLTSNASTNVGFYTYESKYLWDSQASASMGVASYQRSATRITTTRFGAFNGDGVLTTETQTGFTQFPFTQQDPSNIGVVEWLIAALSNTVDGINQIVATDVFLTLTYALKYYTSKKYQSSRKIPTLFGGSVDSDIAITFAQQAPTGNFDTFSSGNTNFWGLIPERLFLSSQSSYATEISCSGNANATAIERQLAAGQRDPDYAFLGTNGTDTVFLVRTDKTLVQDTPNNFSKVEVRKKIVAWVTTNGAMAEISCANTEIISYVTTDYRANNNFLSYNRWIELFQHEHTTCIEKQIQIIGKPLNISGTHGNASSPNSINIWRDALDYPVQFFKHESPFLNPLRLYTQDHSATSYDDYLANPDLTSDPVTYIQSLGVEGDYRDFPYNQGDQVFVNIYEWDEDFNLTRIDPPSDTVNYVSVDTGDELFENGESSPALWSVYLET